MTETEPIIGVVGRAGKLGGPIEVQALSAFRQVLGFDLRRSQRRARRGIDPALLTENVFNLPEQVGTLDEILARCDIVHWAGRIADAKDIPVLPEGALLFLHDSNMANSVEVARHLESSPSIMGQIAVAHCLMNEQKKVVIASDLGDTARATAHITQLGLVPEAMPYGEHVNDSAWTHSAAAVIYQALKARYEEQDRLGLLTPSAGRLLAAMEDNEFGWSDLTLASLLSNPDLPEVIQSIADAVKNGEHLR